MLTHMSEEPELNSQIDATISAMVEHMLKVQGRKDLTATLANGVVIRGKAMPRRILADVVRRLPAPEVPDFEYELGGNKLTEKNPDDPAYKAALAKNHGDRIEATNRAMMSMGTELVSVPDGVFRPEEDGWIEELEAIGAMGRDDVPKLPMLRYLAWLESYVMVEEDASTVWAIALAATGTIEPEVAAAVAYFRREEERRAGVLASALQRLQAPDRPVSGGEDPPDAGAGAGGEGRGEV